MDDREAQRQISQMVNFILNEAKDKAQEIEAKALEDFNIEKLKLVQQMKERIRQDLAKRMRQLEVQRSIARSTAVNRSRLRKMVARDTAVNKVVDEATSQLATISNDQQRYKKIISDLILQGLMRLLEDHVSVRCRQIDKSLVEGVLSDVSSKYTDYIQKEVGLKKTVKLVIDSQFLPPPPNPDHLGKYCCGGVVLVCHHGKITLDNTLDQRLTLAVSENKPQIRKILFPTR
eukprot:GHVL01014492.1.p1 GENE.GHVL01014492.1~~GHVL01014492.1.p1  ORF type:complete len:232 (+),score=29.71 GHVL01014492.1:96-791(+)